MWEEATDMTCHIHDSAACMMALITRTRLDSAEARACMGWRVARDSAKFQALFHSKKAAARTQAREIIMKTE